MKNMANKMMADVGGAHSLQEMKTLVAEATTACNRYRTDLDSHHRNVRLATRTDFHVPSLATTRLIHTFSQEGTTRTGNELRQIAWQPCMPPPRKTRNSAWAEPPPLAPELGKSSHVETLSTCTGETDLGAHGKKALELRS